jgi:DNA-directed RNA polymerase subunit RPC12/RpoP
MTREQLSACRAAICSPRRIGAVHELYIGVAVLLTVLATLAALVLRQPAVWGIAALAAAGSLGLAGARVGLEPAKRRAGYICAACGGTFPTDADDFRLVVRGGHCLRCGARVLEDPEVPDGSHRLPPMTALGER